MSETKRWPTIRIILAVFAVIWIPCALFILGYGEDCGLDYTTHLPSHVGIAVWLAFAPTYFILVGGITVAIEGLIWSDDAWK